MNVVRKIRSALPGRPVNVRYARMLGPIRARAGFRPHPHRERRSFAVAHLLRDRTDRRIPSRSVIALPDPEAAWESPPSTRTLDPEAEVRARLGRVDAPVEVLSGGAANLNLKVGDRVLRVYRRERAALAREAVLLARPWRSFRTPRLLGRGEDYLVLEHVPHRRLDDARPAGAAAGRALAEIHAQTFAVSGFLGTDLRVATPLPDFAGAVRAHLASILQRLAPAPGGDLVARILTFLDAALPALRAAAGPPALVHGDFKAGNLGTTASGELLVLDWEFAYAGPRLMDLAQLVRWRPSTGFVEGLEEAYRGAGLPRGWRRLAEAFDLGNLGDLLARAEPGSRREAGLRERVEQILAGGAPGLDRK